MFARVQSHLLSNKNIDYGANSSSSRDLDQFEKTHYRELKSFGIDLSSRSNNSSYHSHQHATSANISTVRDKNQTNHVLSPQTELLQVKEKEYMKIR